MDEEQNQGGVAGDEPTPPTDQNTPESTEEKLRAHHRVKLWFLDLNKWQQITLLIGVSLVLLMGLWGVWHVFHRQGTVSVSGQNEPVPAPTTVASKLTGLQVDPEVNKRQVTGVMIENSVFARPQSGLNDAGVVFEAIAEGGITRFMALYQDTSSSYIGPVRSVRLYYEQWCQGFNCALAHVGGSPEALKYIAAKKTKDLNQFYAPSYFTRVSSRAAPHNVYTSTSRLDKLEAKKGYDTSEYTGFERLVTEAKVDPATVDVKKVSFDYPGTSYDAVFTYSSSRNTYKRSQAGATHTVVDKTGKKGTITPKVVIAMVVPRVLQSDHKHSTYKVVGSGTAYIFQNGTVVKGKWTKSSVTGPITFANSDGSVIKLIPGKTWVSILDSNADVKYKVVKPQTTTNSSTNTSTAQ
ncbi:DUF3048 domain-containing protein [Candidatus Saccharibacteria bacterium]|nr:DUF3048 domain-containing protein [Candidatus Saccharibacteria bacterium]